MRTIATRHAVEKRDAEAHLFSGPHDPPLLGGVAIVLLIMRPFGTQDGVFKLANHRGMSQIDEYGCGTPERKVMPHPPL